MSEILSAEQPCILCGTLLEVVTIHRDDLSGEERIERTPVGHSESECLRTAVLYKEIWPVSSW